MGIVARQSIKNTIYSFIGVGIGAFYTLVIVPRAFENNPNEWGLIQLISSYVLLFMPFALMGFPNIIIKYWPVFKERDREDFLSFLLQVIFVGLIIISLIIFLFREEIFFSNTNRSSLANKYYLYFFPVFFIHTFFYFFIYFNRVFYKTSFPTFIKDTFIKGWTFILMLAYWYLGFSFDLFFKLYITVFVIQLIIIIIYSTKTITFKAKFNFNFYANSKLKEIIKYGLFSVLAGISSVVITRIDLFMINRYTSLNEVAFYSIALFFITVMQIPSRSISTIVIPFLSDLISKRKDKEVKELYKRTSNNLFLVESFVLLIILLNINQFMSILGETFGQIKYVIIILGFARLYELVNTLNYSLIIFTKLYKYELAFQLILLVLTVVTNILFIPKFGIEGAAAATGITLIINTTIRSIFVYRKFGMHPYNASMLKILFISFISIVLVYFLPKLSNAIISILINSAVIFLIYFFVAYYLNVSEDVNEYYGKYLGFIIKKFNK